MNKVLEIDCTTGQQTERPMTDAETEQLSKDQAETKVRIKADSDKAKAKAALLEKLGITADEAALLLG